MPCSILELQHVDEMWKRQNTKGNVEMKDLVLGKNDTDNLCIFDKKWEWTVRTCARRYFGAPSPLNWFMRLNIYNKTILKRERRKCHASRACVERNMIGYYNKSLDKWKKEANSDIWKRRLTCRSFLKGGLTCLIDFRPKFVEQHGRFTTVLIFEKARSFKTENSRRRW